MKNLLSLALAFCLSSTAMAAGLKVATLHPIIADLARQVGGTQVEVVEILKAGGDVHHFEPAARDIATIRGSTLLLASGKHLETYLDKLRDSLGTGVKVVEVGRLIPSLLIDAKQEVFICCPAHAQGGIDPHWWHSADNMKRAARILADEFSEADAANKASYQAAAKAASQRFDTLKRWAQGQISQIPRSDRKLATAHAAFGYFCKEYGFKSLPVLGLSRADDASAAHIAQTIQVIRDQKIRAIFPEDQANPKVLNEIVRSTGVKEGSPLIADGTAHTAHTFESMLRHNVAAIIDALKP
jgi:ABC-type Zn uptake system ZnuABC Zn-binding protein ZnuA